MKIISKKRCDATKTTLMTYKDNSNEYRWQVKHDNGNIIGMSSEGYKNQMDMLDNISLVGRSMCERCNFL